LGCGEGVNLSGGPRPAGAVVRVRNRKGIAGFVLPCLEVHHLARADAEQDSQNLEVRHLLGQSGVKAAAALFDECKVESGGECDDLEVSGDALSVVTADSAVVRVGVRS